MVASAAPFVPSVADEVAETPIPPERPFALGAGSGRAAARPASVDVATVATVNVAPERSVVKMRAAREQKITDLDPAPRADPTPVATYAPVYMMSGRGLY
jgi:hypothetical protein